MPPRFDSTISLSTILMIFTVVVSVTAAWIANRERTLDNQRNIAALVIRIDLLEARIRTLEVGAREGYPR